MYIVRDGNKFKLCISVLSKEFWEKGEFNVLGMDDNNFGYIVNECNRGCMVMEKVEGFCRCEDRYMSLGKVNMELRV